jgi:CheY-like chemotaxis protein
MVRGIGYPAHSARDGREALRCLRQHPGETRLLIADLVMPLMDGGELGERACELQPRLAVVLMSADPLGVDAELLAGYPEFRVLTKPVAFARLYEVLVELLGPPLGARRGLRPRPARPEHGPRHRAVPDE